MRQHQWQVQRRLEPLSDGWRRWDKAYLLLMSWSSGEAEQLTFATFENSPGQIKAEVSDEDSNLCESLYATTNSNPDN